MKMLRKAVKLKILLERLIFWVALRKWMKGKVVKQNRTNFLKWMNKKQVMKDRAGRYQISENSNKKERS